MQTVLAEILVTSSLTHFDKSRQNKLVYKLRANISDSLSIFSKRDTFQNVLQYEMNEISA